ncbi:MAG: putative Ig domain-containing protein [Synechococcales bacterium]|nr:putative Ig domain-containing protein [Synechococcales bacterium]
MANINLTDFNALKLLYESTGGDRWTNTTNNQQIWNINTDPSLLTAAEVDNWHGVDVDLTTGRVTSLQLANNNLEGSIPADLGNLASLTVLNLSGNQLQGPMPASLGNLTNLVTLDVSDNRLQGSIPASVKALAGFSNFQFENPPYLESAIADRTVQAGIALAFNIRNNFDDLEGNADIINFSSTGLPPGLVLNPTTARVSGTPTTAGTFTVQVAASDDAGKTATDEFTITVKRPISADDWAALKALYLSTGGDRWTNRTNWDINALPSTLDATDVSRWHGVTVNLTTGRVTALDLSNNNLTGTLPKELGDMAALRTLDLSRNQIGGQIPADLKDLGNLKSLRLDENQIRGPLPQALDAFLGQLDDFDLENPPYVASEIPNQIALVGTNFTPLNVSTSFADLNDNITSYAAVGLPAGLALNPTTGEISGNPTATGEFVVKVTAVDSVFTNLDESATDEFVITVKPVINATDFAALTALYLGTDGDNWENRANWDVNADPLTLSAEVVNTWHGVTVDLTTGRVIHLSLSGNQLAGALPTELGNLAALKTLDLSLNRLDGAIPISLGNLLNLEELSLGHNQLSSEIPANLGNLTQLVALQLNDNQFNGEIPANLGDLNQLKFLLLQDNQFTGSLPENFAQLTELVVLGLSHNQLRGPLSAGLQTWLDGISSKGLENPPYLLDGIPDQSLAIGETILLDISGTFSDIEGSGDIVSYAAFGLPAGLVFDTTTGQISGTPAVTGEFSVAITATDDIGQEISDEFIITVQQFVHAGDLAILKALYEGTDGDRWAVSTNWDVNADPATLDVSTVNRWHGVTVDGLTGRVTHLELSSNNLVGSLPAALGNLDALQVLLLDGNQLTGKIPKELGGLDQLTTLLLSNNRLSGAIPPELTALQNLEQLGLAYNQLTGEISPALKAWLDGVFITHLENPPYQNAEIANQIVEQGTSFALGMDNIFSDIEGQGDLVTYAASGLPSGLMIDPSTGEITGTPTVAGDFVVTVTAVDDAGLSVSGAFALKVNPTLVSPEGPEDPLPAVPTPFTDILNGLKDADTIRALEGADLVMGKGGDDLIQGNDGKDILFGDEGNDQLWGGRNRDKLHGGTGNDKMWGNGGHDVLFGNDGNDTLYGGMGRDRLIGGAGSDTFVYTKRSDRRDLITDFQVGTDQIDLSRLLKSLKISETNVLGNIVQLQQRSDRTLVRIDADGSEGNQSAFTLVALKGVSASDLQASDFVF